MSYLAGYLYVAVFAIVGILFMVLVFSVSRLLRPSHKSKEKLSSYECGMTPFGGEWSQFNVRFYIFALLFLIFDVEIAFLYPWAIIFRKLGVATFIEMMLFVGILVLGLIYAWKKGVLRWI